MTTTVVVTVASHEVVVTAKRVTEGEEGHNVSEYETILSGIGESRSFYAHSGQTIIVEETGKPAIELPDDGIPPHVKRMRQEQSELDARLDKLRGFIGTEPFEALPEAERDLLREQHGHMALYAQTLGDRLTRAL